MSDEKKPVFQRIKDAVSSSPSEIPTQGPVETDSARAQARVEVETRRKRGRPFGSGAGNSARAPAAPSSEQLAAQATAEKLSRLLSPDLWEPLVRAPADAMLAMTGNEHWDVSDKEAKGAATCLTAALETAVIQSPVALAVVLTALQLSMMYMPRILKELNLRKQSKIADRARVARDVTDAS